MATAVAKKASAAKKSKAPPAHPPYVEMVKDALLALKERTGSSSYAIAKHIEEQQKAGLPPNFKKQLSVQLKRLIASGKLVKVKNSYKIAPAEKKLTEDVKSKPAAKPKEKTEKAAKKTVAKKEKPTKAAPAKAKGKTVTKPKAVVKPVKKDKVVKTTAKSPAKKVAAAKVKKAAIEKAKKPKSIKSPVKKAVAAKKAKK